MTATANLLTVIQSCRVQGRSVLGFFRQALVCAHHDFDEVVSLIPNYGGEGSSLLVNPQT
jgi:transposase